ncbi:alkaline phosphatase D family protein [Diaphorobacter sp.]|uniref:alkaline phosphatase D family protein n=1 Tax=Diaphorobacter sp. TaxID=1934310 RepID=UPI003917D0BE
MSDAPHSHEDPMHSRRTWLTRAAQLSVAASLPRWAWSKPTALQHDPFSLGVASGDPEPDGFVLWTRLFPLSAADSHPTARALTVRWEVAHDAYFRQIVAKGDALADPAFAHSIHVEVQGLQPDRWYFYRFLLGDAVSAEARTRTAPAPNEMPQRLRAIYASCQRWEHGFYSAWRHACNDAPDLVLFLGDYIYEYATPAETQGLARTHTLPHARTLSDFRNRYALHKSDPDLQAAHAVAPWIVTWDDHEVQNDYTGNFGRDGMSADYLLTRTAAWQAFYEHMPLRVSALKADVFHHLQLYRRIPWGQLARLHILDGRQYRDRQACRAPGSSSAGAVQPGQCAELSDPSRSYLGMEQEQWLQQGLAADARHGAPRWSVVAQQTLFSPRRYPSGVQSTDSWDGYPAARDRLVRAIAKAPPRNTVFLGGDIHQNYVCNVEAANARSNDGRASRIIASEFCGTSISSRSGTTQAKVDAIQRHNPHVLLARCEERGYGVCDITPRHWTTSLRAIDHPMDPHSSAHELARFVVEDQRPGPVRS